ncbi:MAG: hypothetical protein ABSG16_03590 [Candidatus Acidiferrum sp.]
MNNRRDFIASTITAAVSLTGRGSRAGAALAAFATGGANESEQEGAAFKESAPEGHLSALTNRIVRSEEGNDRAEDPRIRRARLAGPFQVTKDATIAELGPNGIMTVLAKGTNEWVCTPGDENKIGAPPMCLNPMGMRWMTDAMQGKAKPTNTAPGVIYMLCGATQRSNTDPTDKTSPAIPIGPHWMVTWPFDATANGLPTTVRDRGAWVMFAGTPYAYLHICGDPWEGNEYHEGDKAVWTMQYAHP